MSPQKTFFKDVLRLFLGHFCAINTAKIFQSHEDIAALLQVKTGAPHPVKTHGTAMVEMTHGKMDIGEVFIVPVVCTYILKRQCLSFKIETDHTRPSVEQCS